MNIGYKVVRRCRDGYESACEVWHTVKYEVGEWSIPGPTGCQFLYIFNSLTAAERFWKDQHSPYRTLIIFKVEYKELFPANIYLPNAYLPEGTLLVGAVKLIKVV